MVKIGRRSEKVDTLQKYYGGNCYILLLKNFSLCLKIGAMPSRREYRRSGRSGGEGAAGPGEGGGVAEVEGWPDTEDTGRRLFDDCWTGP